MAEKPPPLPGWGNIFWHQIYPFQAILSNFGFCGRKASPPHHLGWGKIFWHQIYPFQAILRRLWFLWQKSPPSLPRMRGKCCDIRSIHFRQFRATLICVAEKCLPRMREQYLTPDLSTSGNFEQLWFLWQNSPPPARMRGNYFDTRSIQFRQFWATLVFVAEKPPPPGWGKIFWHQIYPFQQFQANFPSSGKDAFLPQKSELLEIAWSYPFQEILSKFGFCGRKVPPPSAWGKIFWHQIYPFQAILSNFDYCGRKAPPRMREIFLTPDLSISGNFEQLWFLCQKSPPSRIRENFLTLDLSISGNFKQLWFLWQKSLPPPRMRENFLTSDLSNSGNFEQLWFLWQKSPPPP